MQRRIDRQSGTEEQRWKSLHLLVLCCEAGSCNSAQLGFYLPVVAVARPFLLSDDAPLHDALGMTSAKIDETVIQPTGVIFVHLASSIEECMHARVKRENTSCHISAVLGQHEDPTHLQVRGDGLFYSSCYRDIDRLWLLHMASNAATSRQHAVWRYHI